MIPILSIDNMRKSDAETIAKSVPSRELMRRAGEAVFRAAPWKEPVAVVCGSGNNGGDGFVLASLLQESGLSCTLFLLSERFSADGKYYYDRCVQKKIPVQLCGEETDFSDFATLADCLFGTGFRGSAEGIAKTVIEKINQSSAFVVSVDINSGLNGDSGRGEVCVVSDLTVSIGAFQPGHFLNRAKDVMKQKINCDIGIAPADPPFYLLEAKDAARVLSPRRHDSNKSTYGYVALIGGSLAYSGAIRLASMANAAMRAGAGVAMVAAPKSLLPAMVPQILESTLFPLSDCDGSFVFREEEFAKLAAKVKTIAFGMGIGLSAETEKALLWLLSHFTGTLIIDADGLNALSHLEKDVLEKALCQIILTPHNGEFARLCRCDAAKILESPIAAAQAFAREHRVTVLLKGPATVVANGKETLLVDAGSPGMATAGSGDVLSGILAAVCAYHHDPLLAAAAAAYINGKAGEYAEKEIGAVSMIASDTVRQLARVIRNLTE